ncbi:MAG: AzlC family ABC transporter permease [Clostridia bacterium]|nr:AzlC family ABC transporter permease [Clostridia bacterium]
MIKNTFKNGIKDGLPICFGYLAVAFTFGIFAVASGLSVLETVLISLTNVTSAGQLAAVPIIAGGGLLVELALAQLVINLRYALMSLTLSQKMGNDIKLYDRFLIAFVNTDEVFAVSASKPYLVSKKYMYGLILTPYLGWGLGTLLGAVLGDVLPADIVNCLSLAIYGMFVAIVVPEVKHSKPTALCVLFAIVLSCLFFYLPVLNTISTGFVVIICSVIASAVMAILKPIKPTTEDNV